MTSKNLPEITDHAFMRMLREQCATTKPMSRIALELGVDVDDLCAWIMEYREPHKPKAYLHRDGPPITYGDKTVTSHYSMSKAGQRFANWRKAQEGAKATSAVHKASA